jgi:hypothetical protein
LFHKLQSLLLFVELSLPADEMLDLYPTFDEFFFALLENSVGERKAIKSVF